MSKDDQSKTFKKYNSKVYTNRKASSSEDVERLLKIKGLM